MSKKNPTVDELVLTPAIREKICNMIKEGSTIKTVSGATGFPMDWLAFVVDASDLPAALKHRVTKKYFPDARKRPRGRPRK